MIIKKTPVRTSKNFGINEVELKDFEFPKLISEYNGITIFGDTEKFEISENVSKNPLIYGNGKELENEVFEKANKNIKIEDLKSGILNIYFDLNDENLNLIDNIEINATSKSKTTIVIKYESDKDREYYHNGIIRLKALKSSKTEIVIINMLNDKSKNFLSIENEIEDNATVKYTIVDFGGKSSISNYYSNVLGENAKSDLNTIYLGNKNQLFDINYIVEVRGALSEANIEVQGALDENATKNFKGTIDFKKGCKKAKGNENEFCLLLSDTAKSKALPMLLCTEEDVEGSHSTAAGKADDDRLFYIMSRGISEKEAMKLIVKANFNKILENIKDEELKQKIIDEIDSKI